MNRIGFADRLLLMGTRPFILGGRLRFRPV
jgi:hypothetical protein